MPYYISNKHPDCASWATVKEDGTVLACHATKKQAIAQMVAVSLSEDMTPGGTYDGEFRAAPGSLVEGNYVTWEMSGETLYGEIQDIVIEGELTGTDPNYSVEGDFSDPAVLIEVYVAVANGYRATGALIVQKLSALTGISPLAVVSEDVESESEVEEAKLRSARVLTGRMKLENLRRAKGKSLSKVETRVNHTQFEVRQEDDGMRFSGYGAVWNSPSEPLPFTEVIQPGAFRKTLRARNDIKFLWNHDTGEILGSTRAGTLSLTEDTYGLKVEGILPNTTRGRDVAELLRRGDVDAMSFGFSVPSGGDSWSADGATRTLNSVRLHEVSLVAFPAYSATAGTASVRGLDKVAQRAAIDADALADALLKLEDGESLTPEEGSLINQAVGSLLPAEESPSEADVTPDTSEAMLELKKKKLELLLKGI